MTEIKDTPISPTAIRAHFRTLGRKVRDRVTGFTGISSSVSFDLYGCVQVAVTPQVADEKSGKIEDGRWFDEKRLVVLDDRPVMDLPAFEPEPRPITVTGPAEKPAGWR